VQLSWWPNDSGLWFLHLYNFKTCINFRIFINSLFI
jgi:hypothetical protein